MNFFDPAIGDQSGTSQRYVGRAIRDFAKREDEIEAGISGQQHIEGMLNTSLRNLGPDCVDLYNHRMWDCQTPSTRSWTG